MIKCEKGIKCEHLRFSLCNSCNHGNMLGANGKVADGGKKLLKEACNHIIKFH